MCIALESIAPSLRSDEPASRATIQRILYDNWPAFAAKSPQPKFAHRAAFLLAHCRTAMMGGHVERCEHGHVEKVHYNSCRHRCCPGCSAAPRKTWLDKQQAKMLDTAAMQVVFTLPSELMAFMQTEIVSGSSKLARRLSDLFCHHLPVR